jgi:membrane protease YdiL (CAAX protease family)
VKKAGLQPRAEFLIAFGVGVGGIGLATVGFASDSMSGLCGVALSTALGLAGFTWALTAGNSLPRATLLQIGPPERPLPGWRLATAIGGMLALSHLLRLVLATTGAEAGSRIPRIDSLLAQATAPELLAAVLALAVAPAFAEEIFFRGLLLGRLKSRLGAGTALVLSSLLFGAIHLDLAQGAAAVVLGLYLGALTLGTGSTHAAILCHGANNLAAIGAARWLN